MQHVAPSLQWFLRGTAVLLSLAICVAAAPERARAQSCSEFQLVGFSDDQFDGNGGIFAMTAACNAKFAGSRLCTSVEVMSTVDVPTGLSGRAWVRPVLLTDPLSDGADASGVEGSARNLSCNGWDSDNGTVGGLAVDASGRFSARDCDVSRPAACCARIDVPEPSALWMQGSGVAGLLVLARLRDAAA